MLQSLRNALVPERLCITGAHAGFHLVWWLPPAVDITTFRKAAVERGMRFQAVSEFGKRAVVPTGLVIGCAALGDKGLRRHVDELGDLVSRF